MSDKEPIEPGWIVHHLVCVPQELPDGPGGDDPRVHPPAGALLLRRQGRRQAEAQGQAEEQAQTSRR